MSHSFSSDSRASQPAGQNASSQSRALGSHTAHFYASDAGLIAEVGQRLVAALAAGGAAVAIADQPHRRDLAQYVAASGIDLSSVARQGRWLALDASKTLNEFMDGNDLVPERFTTLIGGILDRVAAAVSLRGADRAPLVAYGEMVAVLWQRGNPDASLQLEDLWNDLASTRTFHLSCGWPIRFFSYGADGGAVDRICSQHTHVTPALGYDTLSEQARRRGAFLWQLKAHNVLEHVSQISRQTLAFYRDGASPGGVSITEAVDEVLAIYNARLTANDLSVEKRIRPGLTVSWPQGECKQIFSSLVANAIDASSPGATIYLSARESRHPETGVSGIRLTVGDQGVGIPPSLRPKIFTPFSGGWKDINIGLGLWTVSDLLNQRGGFIHCRSRTTAPSGTLLSVFLPAQPISLAA